jgi:OPT oligopeptide transporter protein
MLVGWGFLSPLSKYYNWAPGPVGDMTTGARGWILWTSLAIMLSDSLVDLIPVTWEFANRLVAGRKDDPCETVHDSEVETDDRLVPTRWVLWGITCSTVAGILIVWLVFGNEGIKPWATLLSFIFGALLSILGYVLRHTLETVLHS